MTDTIKRCGFIAIVGEANAGKSTLVNQIVGSKVSIVTPKIQTTRRKILGLVIKNDTQLILMDTPGIFENERHRMDQAMVRSAYSAASDGDYTVLLIDVTKKNFDASHRIVERLGQKHPLILVLNKIDLVEPSYLLRIAEEFARYPQITNTFMISALTSDGVSDLVDFLCKLVPEGPWMYPEDQLSDLPMRLWASEITREQLVLQLEHELPYEVFVETESWETFKNGSVKVNQVIIAARDSQKAIVLGKGGQQIKKISQRARTEMETHLGHPVHLFLFVKVRENWMEKPSSLRDAGILDE
ncbi:MAG: GTPase Era [Alphaproteobacteria bacterium]|nr:GTPase Era [Alphaproteobacteria bacterium]